MKYDGRGGEFCQENTCKMVQNITQKMVYQPPHTQTLLVLKKLLQFPMKINSPKSELMQLKLSFIQQVKTHTMGYQKFTQESIRLIINIQRILKSFKFTLVTISQCFTMLYRQIVTFKITIQRISSQLCRSINSTQINPKFSKK